MKVLDEWSLTMTIVSNNRNRKQQASGGNDRAPAFNRLILVLGLFLCSCAPIGPNFTKPETDAPAQWSEPEIGRMAYTSPQLARWWEVLDDPVLNNLVGVAQKNNNTLEISGLYLGQLAGNRIVEIIVWISASFMVVTLMNVNAGAMIFFFVLPYSLVWGMLDGEAGHAIANERIVAEFIGVVLAGIAVSMREVLARKFGASQSPSS
jgi:hypothetical protein